MNYLKTIDGTPCCGDCEVPLRFGTDSCPCGWVNPDKSETRVQQQEEISNEQASRHLVDYIGAAHERIEDYQARYGSEWQTKLMADLTEEIKALPDATPKQLARREVLEKFADGMSDEQKQRREFFKTMPAPNDVEGMLEYMKFFGVNKLPGEVK